MSIEEKRTALIKKLEAELDEFVTANVTDGEKKTQHELIKSAAPTIDNCIEIIFALTEYSDNLELTEADYDKLLNSNHTLLALNDRFVSSEYHTTDSAEIIDFINDFVRKEDSAEITRFGVQNYNTLMEGIESTKADNSDSSKKLNFADEFIRQLKRFPKYNVTVENNELSVSLAFSGGRQLDRFPLSLFPQDTDLYNIENPFDTPYLITTEVPVEVYKEFFSIYKNVMRDVHRYNYGLDFPNLPRNETLREDNWHIVDTLGDYVLCAAPTPSRGASNIVQYAVWEYDNVRGGCMQGNYYFDYDSAQRRLAERANVYPSSCVMALDFNMLDSIVHTVDDASMSASDLEVMYQKYDEAKLKKIPQEWRKQFYPIMPDDAELLRQLPEEYSKNIYLLVGGRSNINVCYPYEIDNENEDLRLYGRRDRIGEQDAIYGIARSEGVDSINTLKYLLSVAIDTQFYSYDDPNQGGGRK